MPGGQVPFFTGTYFPKTTRRSIPEFTDLLERVAAFFHENKEDLRKQNDALVNALQNLYTGSADNAAIPSQSAGSGAYVAVAAGPQTSVYCCHGMRCDLPLSVTRQR